MSDPIESDGFGLRKGDRLAEALEEAARRDAADPEAAPLNPPWPWEVVPFDPPFWGLTAPGE